MLPPADPGKGGYHLAVTDAATIRGWWTTDPQAWIGIALARSKLVVLDVDVKNGKPGLTSLAEITPHLVGTLTARTPSGGLHLYYAHPPGVPTKRLINWRPGVDLLADGYVIAPPSGGYSWTT
jgi:hypothetical protein